MTYKFKKTKSFDKVMLFQEIEAELDTHHDIYDKERMQELVDDDALNADEECFMEGWLSA